MDADHERLDRELVTLAGAIQAGDPVRACRQLAQLAIELDARFWREERAIAMAFARAGGAPSPLAKLQREHTRVRQLLAALAHAIDGADGHGIEAIATLRSVLLLHLAKEELLLQAHAAC